MDTMFTKSGNNKKFHTHKFLLKLIDKIDF